MEGSPAWDAGIRSGYNIEAIDGVLDDNAPIAMKRLINAQKSRISLYRRYQEETDELALEKKLLIQYGTRYNVTLNKTTAKESFGLKFPSVTILFIF